MIGLVVSTFGHTGVRSAGRTLLIESSRRLRLRLPVGLPDSRMLANRRESDGDQGRGKYVWPVILCTWPKVEGETVIRRSIMRDTDRQGSLRDLKLRADRLATKKRRALDNFEKSIYGTRQALNISGTRPHLESCRVFAGSCTGYTWCSAGSTRGSESTAYIGKYLTEVVMYILQTQSQGAGGRQSSFILLLFAQHRHWQAYKSRRRGHCE